MGFKAGGFGARAWGCVGVEGVRVYKFMVRWEKTPD